MSFIKSLVEEAAATGLPDLISDMVIKRPSEVHKLKSDIIKVSGKLSRDTSSLSAIAKAGDFKDRIQKALTSNRQPAWASFATVFDDITACDSLINVLCHAYYKVAPVNKLGEKIFSEFNNETSAKNKINEIFKTFLSFGLVLDSKIKDPLEKLLLSVLFVPKAK